MVLPQEDYSPHYVGDTATDLLHTFVDYQDTVFNLAGVVAANMTMRLQPKGGVARNGEGSWSIIDAAKGEAAYAWHANDVAQAGIVAIQAGVPLVTGKIKHFEIKEIEFLQPL